MTDQSALKAQVGEAACGYVENGMHLGLGTGSTAEAFLRALATRVDGGLEIIGVPTSERTQKLCDQLGVPTATLERVPQLDLTIDGADEFDGSLRLIKGGGGALLREKIVARASKRMIVVADETKRVDALGAFPLPIEINGFGMMSTYLAICEVARKLNLSGDITLRHAGRDPFITDSGHLILDASFGRIGDPEALSAALLDVPGVVEHGLFIGYADMVLLAGPNGVETVEA